MIIIYYYYNILYISIQVIIYIKVISHYIILYFARFYLSTATRNFAMQRRVLIDFLKAPIYRKTVIVYRSIAVYYIVFSQITDIVACQNCNEIVSGK